MPLTKEELAQAAIKYAGKYYPHLLSVSKRYGPKAKDIAQRYMDASPALQSNPECNTADFVQTLIDTIRSEFGRRGAKARRKKKEKAEKKKKRDERLLLEAQKAERDEADRKRQTSLSF